jgi:cyclophilin family peptidyl-prolyl cis-trans isomerase
LQQVAVRRLWLAIALWLPGCDLSPTPLAGDAGPTRASPPALDAAPGYDPDWRRPAPSASSTSAPPSLSAVTATLPPGDGLVAAITTDHGTLRCTLLAELAPRAVAGFIWLANSAQIYDGSHITRVMPSLLIAGITPSEPPPWPLAGESWSGMKHDEAGLLCATDRQESGEIVITAGDASKLGASPMTFTVFGRCEPIALITTIAELPAARHRPLAPLVVRTIRVSRPPRAK